MQRVRVQHLAVLRAAVEMLGVATADVERTAFGRGRLDLVDEGADRGFAHGCFGGGTAACRMWAN
jgi:hypothetical protein